MLSVKKTISKIANWINLNRIRITTQSGTTNVQGALRLSNLPSDDVTVLAVTVTSSGGVNWFGLPFKYNNSNWYAKVLDWQNLSAQGNKSVSLKIWYIVGGYCIAVFSRLSAIFIKIGGGANAKRKDTDSKDPVLDKHPGSLYNWRNKLWESYDSHSKSKWMACSKRQCGHHSDRCTDNKNNAKRGDAIRRYRLDSSRNSTQHSVLCAKRRDVYHNHIQSVYIQCNSILTISGRRWAAC